MLSFADATEKASELRARHEATRRLLRQAGVEVMRPEPFGVQAGRDYEARTLWQRFRQAVAAEV
jgi:hypothetical protein